MLFSNQWFKTGFTALCNPKAAGVNGRTSGSSHGRVNLSHCQETDSGLATQLCSVQEQLTVTLTAMRTK